MLAQINKKDMAEMAKKMRAVAQAPQAQDLKLKALAIAAPTPMEDEEETYFELVFKRRRNTTVAPSEHSTLDGHVSSLHAPPLSPSPSRDMVVVREDEGTSFQEEGLWDQSLDAPSFLEKVLLPKKAKEKLMSLKEDRLVQETMRQMG